MKYFAVAFNNGIIKEGGCAVLDKEFNNANIVKVIRISKVYSDVTSGGASWSVMSVRLTPVLYLCTKDLEVGDKMCCSDGSGDETCGEPIVDRRAGFIKKVAQISLGAKWVKSGMEFEEK